MAANWESYPTCGGVHRLVSGFITLTVHSHVTRKGWHLSVRWLGKEVIQNHPLGDILLEQAKTKAIAEACRAFEHITNALQALRAEGS